MFRMDYLMQDLCLCGNDAVYDGDRDTLRVLRGVNEGRMIRQIGRQEKVLRAELEAFLAVVKPSFLGRSPETMA